MRIESIVKDVKDIDDQNDEIKEDEAQGGNSGVGARNLRIKENQKRVLKRSNYETNVIFGDANVGDLSFQLQT